MFGEKTSVICGECSKVFDVSVVIQKRRKIHFCGLACYHAHRRKTIGSKRPTYTCEHCKNSFQPKYKRDTVPRFCSKVCHGKARTGLARGVARPLEKRDCRICKKSFETRVPHRLYCSKECQYGRTGFGASKKKPCEYCSKLFSPRQNNSRFCSRTCLYSSATGENASQWKGGRIVNNQGYVSLYRKEHPASDNMGYVKEHRIVMEEKIGRFLLPNENVHHKNGNRSDNRIENLELWVKPQTPGQRAEDLVAWAREIVAKYGELFPEQGDSPAVQEAA